MARFWKALFTANKSFDVRESSLAPLLNRISGGHYPAGQAFTTAELQEELDKIPVKKAQKYRQALKMLVDDYVDVCYTGVDEFKGRAVARPMNVRVSPLAVNWGFWGPAQTNSGYVEWDSAQFVLEARVFQIVPVSANRWEIGFVQLCDRKDNNSRYTDGAVVNQHPAPAPPWCDTANPTNHPWYTKGNHNGRTAWAALAAGENTVDYGMDDSFDDRKHPYTSVNAAGVVAGSRITEIKCEQKFDTWLCRFDTILQTRLLLKKISYIIKGEAAIKANDQVSGANTSVKMIGNVETPAHNATLPVYNAQTMNTGERWYRNGVQI
jgi:hypothetical protein